MGAPRRVIGVAVTLVAVAVALLLLVWNGSEPPPNRTESIGTRSNGPVDPALGGGERDATSEREIVAPVADGAGVNLAHPFAYELQCRVLDRDGLPVVGARMAFGPRDGTPNRWPEPTASDGSVRLAWRGKVQSMTMAVGLIHGGIGTALREVEVHSGAPRPLAMLVELGGGSDFCTAALSAPSDCRLCHAGPAMPQTFEPGLDWRPGLHPESHFADLLLADLRSVDLAEPPGPWEFDVVEDSVAESTVSQAERATHLPPGPGSIRGRVVDSDGKPVGGATVIWSRERDRPRGRTTTGRDGWFEFEEVPVGDYEVRAGGGSHGLGRLPIEVFVGQPTPCEIRLDLGEGIAGRVLLPEGEGASTWRVEYVAVDESWVDGSTVALDGAFRFANLPPGAGNLLLFGEVTTRLPVAVDREVVVGSRDRVFDLRTVGRPGGSIRLRPTAGAVTGPAPELDVWVWQSMSGRGAAARRADDGTFTLGGLSAGFYRVAVRGDGFGWQSAGEHWIDGLGELDLGTLPLPEPGSLRIEGLTENVFLELCLRRPELDLRGALRVSDRTRLRLPPGQWLALWGSTENLRTREFTVGAASTEVLDLAATRR